jgi:NADH-quinone oxidoreductase subunit M
MNNIVLILLILSGGGVLSFLLNRVNSQLSGLTAFVATVAAAVLFFTGIGTADNLNFTLGGMQLSMEINNYSWIFGALILSFSSLVMLYSISYMKGKDRLGYFYLNFMFSIAAMMGIIFSRDFISLFIFWEIMTWSSFLIVVYQGLSEGRVGIKYMIFSAIGGYSMLLAIVFMKAQMGTVLIADLISHFPTFALQQQTMVGVLLLITFGVKAAVMPLHVWAPRAYSDSPMSYTSVFSGLLSKMGIFGMGIVLISVFATSSETFGTNTFYISNVLAWLGGITGVIATFYAVIQPDAKKLLAYSSIGQLGYIVMGLAVGTKLSVMAALFLAVVHTIFKGTLFLVVGAVERQAGTTDMTKLGALIRKMPWTFVAALISIIALAGIPPLAGFVGKWMFYESLIVSDHYFLVIMAFLSSTAAFLYCYRFLFGLFLGQEEKEFENVKEAPATMVIPMMFMALLLFVFGVFPGLLFEPIAKGMETLGMGNVDWSMTVLGNGWGDHIDTLSIITVIGTVFMLAFIYLGLWNRKQTRYVTTKDIHTSGEIPTENENLTYAVDFYKPFERAIAPVMKRTMDFYYNHLGEGLESFFNFLRRFYTGNGQTYALYVIVFLVILILFSKQIFL